MQEIKLISFGLRTTLLDGDGKLCADVAALHELKHLGTLACICDEREIDMLRAQQKLDILWDFAISLQDMDANAVLKNLANRSFKPQEWLHVSARPYPELSFAKELGAQTCFVPRSRSGNYAADAAQIDPTTMVSDLHQLVFGLQTSKGFAKFPIISISAAHPKMLREFMRWFRFKADDFAQNGLRMEIMQISPLNMYVLTEHKSSAAAHYEAFEMELRETFPEHILMATTERADLLFANR